MKRAELTEAKCSITLSNQIKMIIPVTVTHVCVGTDSLKTATLHSLQLSIIMRLERVGRKSLCILEKNSCRMLSQWVV